MKKLILICALLSMGLHLYLSHRSYSLSAGKADKSSICHINSYLDCDQALSSPYSDLFWIPLSNYGFALHFIMAGLILFLMASGPKMIGPTLAGLATLSAGASLIMLFISVVSLQVFCPFCLLLYLLSFIILGALCLRSSLWTHLKLLFCSLRSTDEKPLKWFMSASLAFLGLAFLTHIVFIQAYDIPSVQKTVKFQVMDWISAPKKTPVGKALLISGPDREKALITVTEFADFLCHHCRNAHYSLKALTLSRLRYEYFSYPLDQCQGTSLSCMLIRAVYCAQKQNKGWALHNLIFEHQPLFISLKNQKEKALEELKELSQEVIDIRPWQKCLNSPSALEIQEQQVRASQKRGVTGTPSLFVNDKKISPRYLTKTLQAIYQHLQKKS